MMKILKNKKGAVLEISIIFMIFIFSLCLLIVCFAQRGRYYSIFEGENLKDKVSIDQIGEDYLRGDLVLDESGRGEIEVWRDEVGVEIDVYIYEATDTTLRVWRSTNEFETALYVEIDQNRNVIAWQYSEPAAAGQP